MACCILNAMMKYFIAKQLYIGERLVVIMDQLMDILAEVNADVDFETCETLMDDEILNSDEFDSIVKELNDAYDIDITPIDVVPENFNSAEAMWELIERLQDK